MEQEQVIVKCSVCDTVMGEEEPACGYCGTQNPKYNKLGLWGVGLDQSGFEIRDSAKMMIECIYCCEKMIPCQDFCHRCGRKNNYYPTTAAETALLDIPCSKEEHEKERAPIWEQEFCPHCGERL